MPGLRAVAEWKPCILSCSGRRPDVRRRQAPGIVGDFAGIAGSGGADVPLAGGRLYRSSLGEDAGRRSAKVPGTDPAAAYRKEAGDRRHAGKALTATTETTKTCRAFRPAAPQPV